MSFNFSKEQVKEQGGATIFNNGVAGRVENVTVEVKKKGVDYQDEGKNKPDYQVTYTDTNGASTNEGFYYLNEKTHNAQWGDFAKAVEKQWNKFANIILAADQDPTLNNPKDAKEVLDQVAILTKKAVEGKTFNVFSNYGTKQNPKKYLQVRSWAPFIEVATTVEADSKLKAGNLDQIERIETPTSGLASATPATEGWV
jgi:hypothetical protein